MLIDGWKHDQIIHNVDLISNIHVDILKTSHWETHTHIFTYFSFHRFISGGQSSGPACLLSIDHRIHAYFSQSHQLVFVWGLFYLLVGVLCDWPLEHLANWVPITSTDCTLCLRSTFISLWQHIKSPYALDSSMKSSCSLWCGPIRGREMLPQ